MRCSWPVLTRHLQRALPRMPAVRCRWQRFTALSRRWGCRQSCHLFLPQASPASPQRQLKPARKGKIIGFNTPKGGGPSLVQQPPAAGIILVAQPFRADLMNLHRLVNPWTQAPWYQQWQLVFGIALATLLMLLAPSRHFDGGHAQPYLLAAANRRLLQQEVRLHLSSSSHLNRPWSRRPAAAGSGSMSGSGTHSQEVYASAWHHPRCGSQSVSQSCRSGALTRMCMWHHALQYPTTSRVVSREAGRPMLALAGAASSASCNLSRTKQLLHPVGGCQYKMFEVQRLGGRLQAVPTLLAHCRSCHGVVMGIMPLLHAHWTSGFCIAAASWQVPEMPPVLARIRRSAVLAEPPATFDHQDTGGVQTNEGGPCLLNELAAVPSHYQGCNRLGKARLRIGSCLHGQPCQLVGWTAMPHASALSSMLKIAMP
jgi:hypothetical protein